ncbi:MAG: FAD-binding protein, partial [Chloroflexota bacterium]|nr:FAD-binding protein [Chloroflexota bacterium]
LGLYYAPDPSSQAACTLGGNVAENSGGAHCLAYGVTTNHVLGLELVLADGSVVNVGGAAVDAPGYDLTGLLVGSEGTFAIVTKIIVRLMRIQEGVRTLLATFDTIDDASRATSAIVADGIIPAALEMMDGLTIEALQKAGHKGLPSGAQAVLLVELEGMPEGLSESTAAVQDILNKCGAAEIRTAETADERDRLWKARKGALGALGQIKPNYYLQDGVIPRSRLLDILRTVTEVSERYGLPIANVFHAGDGNIHPCIVFDQRVPGETEKVVAAGGDILRKCVELGGTLSGEHGVGLEKQAYMTWIFSPADLDAMRAAKRAFDPQGRLNPGKIFPRDEGQEGQALMGAGAEC